VLRLFSSGWSVRLIFSARYDEKDRCRNHRVA
jgi:hypothetical protein